MELNYKSSTPQIREQIGGVRGVVTTNVPASLSTLLTSITALLTLLGQRALSVWLEGDVELQAAGMAVWIATLALGSWRAGQWAQKSTWPHETVKQDFLLDAETGADHNAPA